jgi:hypothetical protein
MTAVIFLKNNINRLNLLIFIFTVSVFLIHLAYVNKMLLPIIYDDQLGYWGTTAYFAGYDWSGVLSFLKGYYSYGYSLLLFPLFHFFSNPSQIYQCALILNSIFMSLVFLLNYKIIKRMYKEESDIILLLISLAFSAYSSYLVQSKIAWTESLLVLLFSAIVYWVLKIDNYMSNRKMVFGAFLLVYIHAVHQRTIGIVVSAFLLLLLYTVFKKIGPKRLAGFILSFFGFFLIHLYMKNHIMNSIYPHFSTGIAGDYESNLVMFVKLFSLNGIKSIIKAVSGQLFYLGCASFGLFFIGMFVCGYNILVATRYKRRFNEKQYFFLMLLLCNISTILISSVGLAYNIMIKRPMWLSHFVYGRYNETVIAITSMVGMIELIRKNILKKTIYIAFLFFILLITAFITNRVISAGNYSTFNTIVALNLKRHELSTNINFIGAVRYVFMIIVLLYLFRALPKISTTYCVSKVAEYNSNPCGICTPVVLSLTSVHQLSERPSHTC